MRPGALLAGSGQPAKRLGFAVGLSGALLGGILATGCASGHAAPAAHHPPAPVAATSASPSCPDLVRAWMSAGGHHDLNRLSGDLQIMSDAGGTGSLSIVQGAASILGQDAQTALGNMPPGCVPGLTSDYGTALHDFSNAASEIGNGDASSINLASTEIQAGGAAIHRATRDIQTAMP